MEIGISKLILSIIPHITDDFKSNPTQIFITMSIDTICTRSTLPNRMMNCLGLSPQPCRLSMNCAIYKKRFHRRQLVGDVVSELSQTQGENWNPNYPFQRRVWELPSKQPHAVFPWFCFTSSVPNHDCASLYRMGGRRENGVYRITPCGNVGTFQVYCDLKFVGGGWTAIQRRWNELIFWVLRLIILIIRKIINFVFWIRLTTERLLLKWHTWVRFPVESNQRL